MSARNEAWKAVEAATVGMSKALENLGGVHAVDVQLLAQANDHLAGLLGLIDARGWHSTWAKDNEKITSAQEYLAAFTATEGNDNGTPSN